MAQIREDMWNEPEFDWSSLVAYAVFLGMICWMITSML